MRVIIVLSLVLAGCTAQNLLQNPDFEGSFDDIWRCYQCKLDKVRVNKGASGSGTSYVARVTDRKKRTGSVYQDVKVQGNAYYHFRAYVKLINEFDENSGHGLEVYIKVFPKGGNMYILKIGRVFNIRKYHQWVEVGGDFHISESSVDHISINFPNDNVNLNYYVDDAELVKLDGGSNWYAESEARIEKLRKGDITIKYDISSKYDPSKVQVSVTQNRHDFLFGFAIHVGRLIYDVTPADQKYRDFIYSLSNVVTMTNKMKWRFMESEKGHPYFDDIDKAIELISAKNISVRGHCMTWAKTHKIPKWMEGMDAAQVHNEVRRRIRYMMQHYKGKLIHMDVNNEKVHGHFYENATDNTRYTENMIRWTNQGDKDLKLCLNDYEVVSDGTYTTAYKFMANLLKDRNVPVHCIGVQGHFGKLPNPAQTMRRVDELASTGLPLTITELDFKTRVDHTEDELLRAYDQLMRLFFSHWAINGIVMWTPEQLVKNNDFGTLNKAGNKVKNLISWIWRTRETLNPSSRSGSDKIRGFYGGYDVAVKYDGKEVSSGTFYIATNHTASYTVKLN